MNMGLDVLDCNKIIRNNNLKHMMTDSSFIINAASCLLIDGFTAAVRDPWMDTLCLGYNLIKVPFIIQQLKSYNGYVNVLVEEMKNTDSYKECVSRYDYFVSNIANYLKSIGVKDSIHVCIYVSIALRLGYFSKNHDCIYKDYKYDPLYTSDILGARVVQGDYVCRHATQFLNDILAKMKIKSIRFSVIMSDKSYDDLDGYERETLCEDHAISIVAGKKGNFAFDITNYYFANCTDDDHQFEIINNPINLVLGKNRHVGYDISNKFLASCDDNNKLLDFMNNNVFDKYFLAKYGIEFLSGYNLEYLPLLFKENMNLLPIDICSEQLEVLDIMSETYGDLENFYDKNKSIMNEIAALEEQIAPRSDKLIKKWILK